MKDCWNIGGHIFLNFPFKATEFKRLLDRLQWTAGNVERIF